MSGFEKYGIKYSSPSQINMWAACPGAWAAKYVYGEKFKYGAAAQVGVLTEQVVAHVLLGSTLEKEVEIAKKKFHKDNLFSTEREQARVNDIEAMATLTLEQLEPYGVPLFDKGTDQRKIEIACKGDGWELPIIGYLDFYYPEHGLIIDLKTTSRMPSVMSKAHQRQAAIYSKAMGNMGVKFLYVTPKKAKFMEVDDEAKVLAEVKGILNRQEKMLDKFSKEELSSAVPVNYESFYWYGAENILERLYN